MKKTIREKDTAHIWHPYTHIDEFEYTHFPIIDHARGCYLYDTDGNQYMDGIASWWCVNFGHSRPELLETLKKTSDQLQHVILGGMSHKPVIALAEKLASITPKGLNRCFFAGDGSSAVEAGLRMALQYWDNQGVLNKTKFISLEEGYHGDTLGAIGVGYVDTFHHSIQSVVMENFRARSPHCAQCPFAQHPDTCHTPCVEDVAQLLKEHSQEVAAVVMEPLCQGAAGIRLYPEQYVQKVRRLCDTYGVLLMLDEIAVGFGRTGSMFASEKAGITPDILILGKGLTGGYLPMSVAMTTDAVYDTFRNGHTLYHGHTFSGNPMISSVALRALQLYEELTIVDHIQPLIKQMKKNILRVNAQLPESYADGRGMIAMVEISPKDGGIQRAKAITKEAMKLGLFMRPLGNVVYLWPPLIIESDQLQQAFDVWMEAITVTQ